MLNKYSNNLDNKPSEAKVKSSKCRFCGSPEHTTINCDEARVFVGPIRSDCNPIRTVIFPCLTKTDMSIGLAMFCKQRRFGNPRTVHHTENWLKLPFYRTIRIYWVDFEKTYISSMFFFF